jgi:hypothetical protein
MTVEQGITIRVWVVPVWDAVRLEVTPDWTVAQLKDEALARATGKTIDPAAYLVKYRGAPLLDETQTLGALQLAEGAPFIVLPRRRQPVR